MSVATAQTGDVEKLVLSLYEPGIAPQRLVDIQRHVHQLQLSEHGWEMANQLLASVNPTARFFGALTYSIKLNSAHEPLSSAQKDNLEQSIIHWITQSIANADWRTVTKLCTTLALFHLQSIDRLATSVSALVFALLQTNVYHVASGQTVRSMEANVLSSLKPESYRAVLKFVTALAEEAAKTASSLTPVAYANLTKQYTHVTQDIAYLIYYALEQYHPQDTGKGPYDQLRNESIASLAATSHFYLTHGQQQEEILDNLRTCLTSAISWTVASASGTAIDHLVESLGTGPRIWKRAHFDSIRDFLIGPWGAHNLEELKSGAESGEDNVFIALLLAYGEAEISSLMQEVNHPIEGPKARQILEVMQELLNGEGYPELEDQIIPRALGFWTTFVEIVGDGVGDGDASDWIEYAMEHVIRMSQQIRIKVCLPPWAEWQALSAEERGLLRDFRTDVRDLLQSSYWIVGAPLVEFLVSKALEAADKTYWRDAESALFCLAALEASGKDKHDALYTSLFESQLFMSVLADDDPSQIARRTAIDLLGHSTRFFKRNTKLLPAALNFLFPSLQHPKSSDQASRSIFALCSACRQELVPDLPVFLTQYETFIALPTVSEFAIERISGAIGVLLQALPSLAQTISGVDKLLTYVSSGLSSAKQLLQQGQNDQGCVVAGKSMRCLSSIAKSLQAPVNDEDFVDVEADESVVEIDNETKAKLDNLQVQIFGILSLAIEILGDDGEIIDDVCNVFKAGFTEPKYSPFHFAPHIVVQFFSITNTETPRIESVLRMGCAFLRSIKTGDSDVDTSVALLAQHLTKLTQQLGEPSSDAEVAQSIIEMLTRFIPNHVHTLLHLQPVSLVETLFSLTISAIEVPEPLPKRSALIFWSNFLDASTISADESTRAAQEQVIAHYGPALAAAISRQIAGHASRVDLEFFSNPLRKFVKRHAQARPWIEAALLQLQLQEGGEAPRARVNEAVVRRFVAQLGVVGTQRQVRELITGFWSHCQGMSRNYAPMKAVDV